MKVLNVIRRALTEARTYAAIAVAAFLSFQVVPDDVKVQATAAMMAIGTAVYLLAYYWGTVDATAETTKDWEVRYNADIAGLLKGYKERKAELEAELRGARANLKRQKERNAELAERARQVANLEAERDAANARIAELEERNAELTARWDAINSAEAQMRKKFDMLNEREKWLLAHVVYMYPKTFSLPQGSYYLPDLKRLANWFHMLDYGKTVEHGEKKGEAFTLSPEWRDWLLEHRNELPNPNEPVPC